MNDVLKKATSLKATSILIPGIGTGVNRIPFDVCARTTVSAIDNYLSRVDCRLKEIKIVDSNENLISSFLKHTAERYSVEVKKTFDIGKIKLNLVKQNILFSKADVIGM